MRFYHLILDESDTTQLCAAHYSVASQIFYLLVLNKIL